jgi:hypothetical protein
VVCTIKHPEWYEPQVSVDKIVASETSRRYEISWEDSLVSIIEKEASQKD